MCNVIPSAHWRTKNLFYKHLTVSQIGHQQPNPIITLPDHYYFTSADEISQEKVSLETGCFWAIGTSWWLLKDEHFFMHRMRGSVTPSDKTQGDEGFGIILFTWGPLHVRFLYWYGKVHFYTYGSSLKRYRSNFFEDWTNKVFIKNEL